jgi:hypothetical protein
MLVRADARRQEFAVRAALGAVPARIARALLVESLLLGAGGCVLGLLLAFLGLQVLVALGPSNLPRLQEIAVYPPVLAFTVAVSLAATLIFGSVTALKHAWRSDAPQSLGARSASASRERNATRNTLVVVQVALALVLVVSAALMIRTFQALRDVDPGFSDPATIQTAWTWAPPALFATPEQYTRLQHEMLDKVAALPGVSSAAFASALPMEPHNNGVVLVRLARLLRSDGHATDRGARHRVERHRIRRPRRRDLREFCSRARGRARGSARPTYPAASGIGCVARGDRRGAERPRDRLIRGTAELRVLARARRELER